jgi:hypothetical protein
VTQDFRTLLERGAKLPPMYRPLTESDKRYLRFRLSLRRFDQETVQDLATLYLPPAEAEALRARIQERILEDQRDTDALSTKIRRIKVWEDADYLEAGRLLFSLSRKTRRRIAHLLAETHLIFVRNYRDHQLRAVAEDRLLFACQWHNMYVNLMKDRPDVPVFTKYLKSVLNFKHVRLDAYHQSLSGEEKRLHNRIRNYRGSFKKRNGRRPTDDEVVEAMIGKGYMRATVESFLKRGGMLEFDSGIVEKNGHSPFDPSELGMFGFFHNFFARLRYVFTQEDGILYYLAHFMKGVIEQRVVPQGPSLLAVMRRAA